MVSRVLNSGLGQIQLLEPIILNLIIVCAILFGTVPRERCYVKSFFVSLNSFVIEPFFFLWSN